MICQFSPKVLGNKRLHFRTWAAPSGLLWSQLFLDFCDLEILETTGWLFPRFPLIWIYPSVFRSCPRRCIFGQNVGGNDAGHLLLQLVGSDLALACPVVSPVILLTWLRFFHAKINPTSAPPALQLISILWEDTLRFSKNLISLSSLIHQFVIH